MSVVEHVCPKCGGKMVVGRMKISVDRLTSQAVSPFNMGLPTTGMPNISGEVGEGPFWEEKTGEKKGFIFKSDEIKKMSLRGYRCTLCNYIEIYAKD
jgi:DNA-directed RNA polymerase subunit RPC12/RpoP